MHKKDESNTNTAAQKQTIIIHTLSLSFSPKKSQTRRCLSWSVHWRTRKGLVWFVCGLSSQTGKPGRPLCKDTKPLIVSCRSAVLKLESNCSLPSVQNLCILLVELNSWSRLKLISGMKLLVTLRVDFKTCSSCERSRLCEPWQRVAGIVFPLRAGVCVCVCLSLQNVMLETEHKGSLKHSASCLRPSKMQPQNFTGV